MNTSICTAKLGLKIYNKLHYQEVPWCPHATSKQKICFLSNESQLPPQSMLPAFIITAFDKIQCRLLCWKMMEKSVNLRSCQEPTSNSTAPHPNAPEFTQSFDNPSSPDARPSCADISCGAISKAQRNCSTPYEQLMN